MAARHGYQRKNLKIIQCGSITQRSTETTFLSVSCGWNETLVLRFHRYNLTSQLSKSINLKPVFLWVPCTNKVHIVHVSCCTNDHKLLLPITPVLITTNSYDILTCKMHIHHYFICFEITTVSCILMSTSLYSCLLPFSVSKLAIVDHWQNVMQNCLRSFTDVQLLQKCSGKICSPHAHTHGQVHVGN